MASESVDSAMGHPSWIDPTLFVDQQALQDQDLICNICIHVLSRAQETPCGHAFCAGCIEESLKVRTECPVCRVGLSKGEMRAGLRTDKLVGRQRIKCEFTSTLSCPWVGYFSDYERHLVEHKMTACPNNGCIMRVLQKNLPAHQAECPFQVIECKHQCGVSYKRREEGDHMEVCDEAPMQCDNNCDMQPVSRKRKNQHLEEECPLADVACPYSSCGCDFHCKRKHLDDHITSTVGVDAHLLMASEKVRVMMTEKDRKKDDLQKRYVEAYRLYLAKDYGSAFAEFASLASEGHAMGSCQLGYMYHMGEGIPRNNSRAIELFAAAARQGDAASANNIGLIIRNDMKDDAAAVRWFQKAADLDHEHGFYNLGYHHEVGKGVSKDIAKAIEYYRKAALKGMELARTALNRLNAPLHP